MHLRKLLHRLIAVIVAVCWLTSCATLIHGGGTQTVSINTDPPGAKITVDGQNAIAPAELKLDRDRDHQVVAELPGYDDGVATIQSHFSWITIVDVVLIFPWLIDLMSGGSDYLDPDAIDLVLAPRLPPNPYAPAGPTR